MPIPRDLQRIHTVLRTAAVGGLSVMLLPACGGAESAGPDWVAWDSAGVEVVHSLRPAWEQGPGWRLAESPSLAIGEPPTSSKDEFTTLRTVRSLPDGRIVVPDLAASPEIRVFGPDGTYLHAVGRAGEGPGEYGFLWDVWVSPPDTLVAFDPNAQTVSYFTADGAFVRSVRLTRVPPLPGGSAIVLLWARFGDGTFLLRPNVFLAEAEGTGRTRLPAIRVRDDGSVVDTIGVFPDVDHVPAEGGRVRQPLFGKRAAILVHESAYFTGMGDDFTIDEYDVSGRHVRRMRRDHEPREVTDDLVARERDRALAGAAPESREAIEARYAEAPRARHLPAYSRDWLVSPDGHLWVQHYHLASDPARMWSVFNLEGRWLGTVDMPVEFRALEIGTEWVLGVWRDDMDVQTVRRYDLIRPPGPYNPSSGDGG